jgi:hypothetical protein
MIKKKLLKNQPDNTFNKKEDREVPVTNGDSIKLPALGVWSAKRGQGKTVSALNLSKDLIKQKAITRVFVISPTYMNHKNMFLDLGVHSEEDGYDDIKNYEEALMDISRKVKGMSEEWKNEKKYNESYQKLLYYPHHLTEEEIDMLETYQCREPDMGKMKVPGPLLICDDIMNSDMLSQSGKRNTFTNLCIRHRHLHGVGLSIFIISQAWKGLPRWLRLNATFSCIGKTHDKSAIQDIADEVSNMVTPENFIKIYNEAVSGDPYNFLFIDFNPKKTENRFRKCFNEALLLEK